VEDAWEYAGPYHPRRVGTSTRSGSGRSYISLLVHNTKSALFVCVLDHQHFIDIMSSRANYGIPVTLRREADQEHFRLLELPPNLLALLTSENPPM
jgi:hypothetical protein